MVLYRGDNCSGECQSRQLAGQTGFDNLTNGFAEQGPDFNTIDEDNVVPTRSFNDGRFVFEGADTKEEGLGPIYNAQSCGACHQNWSREAPARLPNTGRGIPKTICSSNPRAVPWFSPAAPFPKSSSM